MTMILRKCRAVFAVLAASLLLAACHTSEKVIYFQDLMPGDQFRLEDVSAITLRPGDKVTIVVNSRDPQLMALFNLPQVNKNISATSAKGGLSSDGGDVLAYTVDTDGSIDFPVLGKIGVAGMTREQLAAHIKRELVSRDLVKDPIVTVEYANLCVNVLGEVSAPGRYAIDRDRTTILDVLSMAGDLTIQGKRDRVLVIRQEDGLRRTYAIDMTSSSSVYGSPAYYMRQNDVVYVEPNAMRTRQSTVNGNNVRSTSFWFSLASLLTSLTTIFIVK